MAKTNLDRYRADLTSLIDRGDVLLQSAYADFASVEFDLALEQAGNDVKSFRAKLPVFRTSYQSWYTEALVVIRQLLPARLADFEQHYKKPRTRKELTYENYRIEDALQGLGITNSLQEKLLGPDAAIPHVEQQVSILKATLRRFESSLFEIQQLVRADLFDSELDAACELLKNGFSRAAGAIAGVILEKHLGQVAENHALTSRKSHPSISDFNELLKAGNVIDIPSWRNIQRLADLRNLCDHNKHRDPTAAEVEELIAGVDKLTKTLF